MIRAFGVLLNGVENAAHYVTLVLDNPFVVKVEGALLTVDPGLSPFFSALKLADQGAHFLASLPGATVSAPVASASAPITDAAQAQALLLRLEQAGGLPVGSTIANIHYVEALSQAQGSGPYKEAAVLAMAKTINPNFTGDIAVVFPAIVAALNDVGLLANQAKP